MTSAAPLAPGLHQTVGGEELSKVSRDGEVAARTSLPPNE